MHTRKANFSDSDSVRKPVRQCLVSLSWKAFDLFSNMLYLIKGEEVPPSTLKLVQIYFDTATFDEIERDVKVKFTAALSLIGGTMGLLTGFSIISGIEIIFFLFELISPFVTNFLKQKLEYVTGRYHL